MIDKVGPVLTGTIANVHRFMNIITNDGSRHVVIDTKREDYAVVTASILKATHSL